MAHVLIVESAECSCDAGDDNPQLTDTVCSTPFRPVRTRVGA